jgi:hypothetical protein
MAELRGGKGGYGGIEECLWRNSEAEKVDTAGLSR